MRKAPYLSVVIPCYNEEENLKAGALDTVKNFLAKKDYTWEVLVVDDGSSDKSRQLIKEFIKKNKNFFLIKGSHLGKASAVIHGINKAAGEYVLFSDLDQATPIKELDKMVNYLPEYDLVIGSRKGRRKGAPLFRLLMARGFMLLRGLILGLGELSDTQCGFKMFKKQTADKIFERLALYGSKDKKNEVIGSRVSAGFDVEVLFIAKKLGYKIKEADVAWQYVDTRRVSPIIDSVEGLIDLVRIRINSLKGVYD